MHNPPTSVMAIQ